jgi:hypothetical protein
LVLRASPGGAGLRPAMPPFLAAFGNPWEVKPPENKSV